ncbi:hypothetical protein C8F01DRAFT_1151511 [Mycena amicta]|nr:hypothetical protein C8F01DRAFT_1151511 [Mycena amicta]
MGDLRLASQPKLPPQLECHIFQLAARLNPELVPALLVVAWRVKEWIEPLLYNTLILQTELTRGIANVRTCTMDLVTGTQAKSPVFLRKNVVNCMLFIVDAKEARPILSVLQRVENLFISVSRELSDAQHAVPPEILNLPLKQLYTGIQTLVTLERLDPLAYSCFRNLTHFELFTNPSAWGRDIAPWPNPPASEPPTSWAFLTRLPSLTHLALNNGCPADVSEFLLSHCVSLRALLLITSGWSVPHPGFIPDSRFVVMIPMSINGYLQDWKDGAFTGNDYWSRVDRFIARRLLGEIDNRELMLTDD